MKRSLIGAAVALACLMPASGALARPGSPPAPPAAPQEEEAEPVEIDAPPPPSLRRGEQRADAAPEPAAPAAAPAPAPEESEPEPAVTTTVPEPAATTAPVNPYANSYNEILPLEPQALEEERSSGFDDWGLLGLLGLLGLFGLKRRDRVVYAERIDQ